MPDDPSVDLLRLLQSFHREADEAIGILVRHHGPHLQCRRGCAACCVDEVTVFEIEASLIRTHYAALLARGRAHEPGCCAFLSPDRSCRIYRHRPYVCRSQGLPLRWLERPDDALKTVEYRDICAENDRTLALLELAAEQCWTIGPWEAKLRALQQRYGGGLDRQPLRALFRG